MGKICQKLLPLFLISLFSVSLVYADSDIDGVLVTTDKTQYEVGELLVIYGEVVEKKMPVVALRIYDPFGEIITANNVDVEEDSSFSKIIELESPFYDFPGTYVVKIDYGKLQTETSFEILDSFSDVFDADMPTLESEVLAMVTDKDVYTDGDFIVIAGLVTAIGDPSVLVGVYDPLGTPIGFYFGDIDENLEFSVSFQAKDGINFKTDGTYSAVAHYGNSENEISFDFVKQKQTQPVDKPKSQTPKTQLPVDAPKPIAPVPMPVPNIPSPEPKQEHTKNEISNDKKPESEIVEENDNLSVEDVELGLMLNEMQLNCDTSKFSDSIIYYDGMGPALLRLCKYKEALMIFERSLAQDSNNIEIITNKGTTLNKLGFYKESLIYFDRALDIDPHYVPAINNKANVLASLGDFEKAKTLYLTSLQIQPDHYNARVNYAKINSIMDYVEKTEVPIILVDGKDEQVKLDSKIETKPDAKSEVKTTRYPQNSNSNFSGMLDQIGSVVENLKNILAFMAK